MSNINDPNFFGQSGVSHTFTSTGMYGRYEFNHSTSKYQKVTLPPVDETKSQFIDRMAKQRAYQQNYDKVKFPLVAEKILQVTKRVRDNELPDGIYFGRWYGTKIVFKLLVGMNNETYDIHTGSPCSEGNGHEVRVTIRGGCVVGLDSKHK